MADLILRDTDPDSLRAAIVADVVTELRSVLLETTSPLLVDGDEMARLVGVHRSTIDRYVGGGIIPSVLIGRARRFRPEAVIEALTVASANKKTSDDHA